MKLIVKFEGNEMMTNIGMAKAIIDTQHFNSNDLSEIGQYLQIYSNARITEKIRGIEKGCVEE